MNEKLESVLVDEGDEEIARIREVRHQISEQFGARSLSACSSLYGAPEGAPGEDGFGSSHRRSQEEQRRVRRDRGPPLLTLLRRLGFWVWARRTRLRCRGRIPKLLEHSDNPFRRYDLGVVGDAGLPFFVGGLDVWTPWSFASLRRTPDSQPPQVMPSTWKRVVADAGFAWVARAWVRIEA